jgi:hypothetical protein
MISFGACGSAAWNPTQEQAFIGKENPCGSPAMIQRDDLDFALSSSELEALRLVGGYSDQPISPDNRDLLLSLKLIRHHNALHPFVLTEAGRRRLSEEDASLQSDRELHRAARSPAWPTAPVPENKKAA